MIKNLNVYITDCTDPYINLATEQYLFEKHKKNDFTMYLWQNENTVVIGKNQNVWAECDLKSMEADAVTLARRMSGGGAVYHDTGNLNFTFIYEKEEENIKRNMQIIQKACQYAGIKTELSGRNDILTDGRKFSGNAFYNSKFNAYHHGTIMINTDVEKLSHYLTPSGAKLEAKGVKSVKSRVLNLSDINPELTPNKMKEFLIKSLEEIMRQKAKICDYKLSEDTLKLAEFYKSKEHIFDKQPPFKFSYEGRFPWGGIDIRLNVEKGIVTQAKVYTDSMNYNLGDIIEKAITGIRFDNIKNVHLPPDVAGDIVKLLE